MQDETLVAAPARTRRPALELHDCPICGPAGKGESWADVCLCDCLRMQHTDYKHETASIGPGSTCSGRNLAGGCRRHPTCTAFRLKEKRRG